MESYVDFRMRRRWLVSQNGYRLLRRQAHTATTNRSDFTAVPSSSVSSTGPSTSTGPPGTTVTRRTSSGREFEPVGTDHHQFLVTLSGFERQPGAQPVQYGAPRYRLAGGTRQGSQ
jgi:hypothetical protein